MVAAGLDERYFLALAAACARGHLGLHVGVPDAEAFERGLAAGLRLHKFKRNAALPRVQKALGMLRSLAPSSLLDVGSGRGTFLWPLLDAFPDLEVMAVDRNQVRARDLEAVGRGGLPRLRACCLDAAALDLPADAVDGATVLEVLEHVERPETVAAEALRVASRFVLVSVPSKPDENPEHVRLFTGPSLERLLRDAGARSVKLEYVPNHLVALAHV